MPCLRASTLIVRLVLAWFVATLGSAVASPLAAPQRLHVVCTASGGATLVVVDDDHRGTSGPARHALDCPACLPVVPHPPFQAPCLPPPSLRSPEPAPPAAAHSARTTGAALPPRGPPTA